MTMPSMFSYTGIPAFNGMGSAYPPGSSMALFLDGLNSTTANAAQLGNVNGLKGLGGAGGVGGMSGLEGLGLQGGGSQQDGFSSGNTMELATSLFSMLQLLMQQVKGLEKKK